MNLINRFSKGSKCPGGHWAIWPFSKESQAAETTYLSRRTLVGFCIGICLCTSQLVFAQHTTQLLDYLNNNAPLDSSARKVVVLIHGWNPGGDTDVYSQEHEWSALRDNLTKALAGSEWKLVLYHWENNANTGNAYQNLFNIGVDVLDWGTTSTAAARAMIEGNNLGSLLASLPNLREVQFIAHSAGIWAAKQAATWLLLKNPYVSVQITLLDPYVPDAELNEGGLTKLFNYTSLNDSAINGIRDLKQGGRIVRLENYYADDSPFHGWNIGVTPWGPTLGTQEVFNWTTGVDENLRVDWGTAIPIAGGILSYSLYYDWHAGPIQFYADTILGVALPSLPTGSPYDYRTVGWNLSLFNWDNQLPQITSQPESESVQVGDSLVFHVAASRWTSVAWYRLGGGQVAEGPDLTLQNVTTADSGVQYIAQLGNADGEVYSDAVTLTVGPSTLTITGVSPEALTGLPLGQTQLIRILGSGFTANSKLTFSDSVNSLYAGRIPVFVNASELDYSISVGSNAGNWMVQVVDGSEQSNWFGFSVVAAPQPTVGSLSVTLSPAAAVASGAQWQIDGGAYHNSGDVVTNVSLGVHTVNCKPITGFAAPSAQSVTITSGLVTSDTETYVSVVPSTYTLTLNQPTGGEGSITDSPFGAGSGNTFTYTAGATVQLTANANFGYHFAGWSGDVAGTANPVTITMDSDKTVTANFAAGGPRMGTVTVTILPAAAAEAGVKWGWNANDYRDSGTSVTTFPATYILTLHPVDGWIGPSTLIATVVAGQTTNLTATFAPDTTPGMLTTVISPPNATAAGARWHVDGGTAESGGATLTLAPGSHTVTFDPLAGWSAPPSQTVQVQRAQTTVVTGNYTPPVGQPQITAIYPNFAALAGGATLTIEGINFAAPATVTIGGKTATNVNVASPSQVTCTVPSSTVYGTVPVTVQTSEGTAISTNLFAYGTPRGNGIELVASYGGRFNGVAVQGNYVYVGEGNSLLALDVSNPSAPILTGRLSLPGEVYDIAVNGQYVYVADGDAGLQVVDIGNPTIPLLKGYYQTPGITTGVAVQGGRAYVADGAGLNILDLANPLYPSLVSSASYNGFADTVRLQTNAGGTFAYLTSESQLWVADVTNPSAPVVRGNIQLGSMWADSIAVSGPYVFAAMVGDGLYMVNVSNPDAPQSFGRQSVSGWPESVATANGLVYAVGQSAGDGLHICSVGSTSLSQLGQVSSVTSDGGFGMVVSNGKAYIAGGGHGLVVADVSNAGSPAPLGAFTDSGACNDFFSVASSGTTLCASTNTDFQVYDISEASRPHLVSQLSGDNGAWVAIQGSIAYLGGNGTNAGSTKIISMATPSAPQLLSTITYQSVYNYRMTVTGNRLFVTGSTAGDMARFAAFDVTSPSAPTMLGHLDYSGLPAGSVAVGVAVNGNKAVVGLQPNGGANAVSVLDLSNIAVPVERGRVAVDGIPWDIALSADGHYAFVAERNMQQFDVLDVSVPTSPSLVATVPITGYPWRVSLTGSLLYLGYAGTGDTLSGVYVYDVSNPAAPVLVKSYPTGGYAVRDIDVSTYQEGIIYTANENCGLSVLHMKDLSDPMVGITAPTSTHEYTTASGIIDLAGSASDDTGVVSVIWSNDRGGSGVANGTTAWSTNGITCLPGTNIITVTAFDASGNSGTATLTVDYQIPKADQTVVFPSIADRVYGDPPILLNAAASSGLTVAFAVTSGPATLSGDTLTITGAGIVTVEAGQSGDSEFNAATPVDVTFNVSRADQSIAFAPVPNQAAGGPPVTLDATASSSLPVYFNVVSGPAVLEGNDVTLLGAGTVVIDAWQPGGANYNAAQTVQRSFDVVAVPQTITFGALSPQRVGDAPFSLAATSDSGLPVSFSVVSGPATIVGNTIIVTGPGTVTVRASQAGDGVYGAATNVDQTFHVLPAGIQPGADFNGDGLPDVVYQSTSTGVCEVWLMNGTSYGSTVTLGGVSSDWQLATTGDFNGDGQPDLVFENTVTGDRVVWLMNGTSYVSSVVLGTVPIDWVIAGAADFSGDGHTDLLFQDTVTGACAVWLMDGTTYAGSVSLGSVSPDWELMGAADFNGDGHPDLLFENRDTGTCAVWLMDGATYIGSASLGSVPPDWQIAATGDFNGDGQTDIVFQNVATGQRAIWLMNGTTYISSVSLGAVSTDWRIAGHGSVIVRKPETTVPDDFNTDGTTDLVWHNDSTGELRLWLMGPGGIASTVKLGSVSTDWQVVATGDYTSDGQPDILWRNTTTGDCAVWQMSGTTYVGSISLGSLSSDWTYAGQADFNADGTTDLVWHNSSTGELRLWLMDSGGIASTVKLGSVSTDWQVVTTGDYTGDGQPDILWRNTITGDCAVWQMSGTTYAGSIALGALTSEWIFGN